MALIKTFFVEHGEKVGLGLVALLCLNSLFGLIMRDPDVLSLPEGRPYIYKEEELSSKANSVKRHLTSKDVTKPLDKIKDTSTLIERQLLRHTVRLDPRPEALEWLLNAKPPKPEKIAVVKSVNPPAPPQRPVPYPYRTRVGGPTQWQLHVGSKGILVICKDNPNINYPQDGSVHTALFAKAAGTGRETLTTKQRESFMRARAGMSIAVEMDEPTAAFGGTTGGFEGFDFGDRTETAEPERAAVFVEEARGRDYPLLGGVARTKIAYRDAILSAEKEVSRNIRLLADPAVQVPTKWHPVTQKMKCFAQPLTEEQIATILKDGVFPPEYDPANDNGNATTPVKTGPRVDIFGNPIKEVAPTPNPTGGAVDGGGEGSTYQPKYYAYLHQGVDENTLYRYRMITYLRTKEIPPKLRIREEHKLYTEYTEIADMGARYFAFTQGVFEDYLKTEKANVGAPAKLIQPTPITYIDNAQLIQEGEEVPEPLYNVAGLRTASGRRSARARAYMSDNSYSNFAYTGVVLTPMKRRIVLTSGMVNVDTEEYESARIAVETFLESNTYSATFTMQRPLFSTGITWKSFVVTDKGGRVSLDDDYRPVLKDIDEVYGPLAKKNKAQIVRIGEKEQVVRGKRIDFDTRWGLVDIRRCRVIVRRYNEVTAETGAEGGRLVFKNRSIFNRAYLVVREMDPPAGQKARFKRIIQKLPTLTPPYTIEVLWEPDFAEMAAKRVIEDRIQLKVSDILNWKAFCAILIKEAKGPVRTPARRAYTFLNDAGRDILENSKQGAISDEQKKTLIDIINKNIIGNANFYSAVYFPDVPPAAKALLDRHIRSLNEAQAQEVSRRLFETLAGEKVIRRFKNERGE